MLPSILAALTSLVATSPSFAADSACLLTVRNSISGLERSAHIPSFELSTISQSPKDSGEEITLVSSRPKGLGNKWFFVDVTSREVGDNKETICEIKSLRSFLEQN